MFICNYIPDDHLKTLMLPLVKYSAGYTTLDLSRQILSKLIALIILNRCESILISCDNQFGSKKNLSPDMCIFFFKQVVYCYVSKSNAVYVCFIDASKVQSGTSYLKSFNHGKYLLIQKTVENIYFQISLSSTIAYLPYQTLIWIMTSFWNWAIPFWTSAP